MRICFPFTNSSWISQRCLWSGFSVERWRKWSWCSFLGRKSWLACVSLCSNINAECQVQPCWKEGGEYSPPFPVFLSASLPKVVSLIQQVGWVWTRQNKPGGTSFITRINALPNPFPIPSRRIRIYGKGRHEFLIPHLPTLIIWTVPSAPNELVGHIDTARRTQYLRLFLSNTGKLWS